jgi:hypothetical protein
MIMTEKTNLTFKSIDPMALLKPTLIGAGIAFLAISFFVFGVDEPNPNWGKFWMIRPLVVTPLAGATGGAFFYFMNLLRRQYGWNKILINFICLLVFIVGLWLGIVLGLDGTMWH